MSKMGDQNMRIGLLLLLANAALGCRPNPYGYHFDGYAKQFNLQISDDEREQVIEEALNRKDGSSFLAEWFRGKKATVESCLRLHKEAPYGNCAAMTSKVTKSVSGRCDEIFELTTSEPKLSLQEMQSKKTAVCKTEDEENAREAEARRQEDARQQSLNEEWNACFTSGDLEQMRDFLKARPDYAKHTDAKAAYQQKCLAWWRELQAAGDVRGMEELMDLHEGFGLYAGDRKQIAEVQRRIDIEKRVVELASKDLGAMRKAERQAHAVVVSDLLRKIDSEFKGVVKEDATLQLLACELAGFEPYELEMFPLLKEFSASPAAIPENWPCDVASTDLIAKRYAAGWSQC